jgi:RNA polymerase sigma-70 factor (TIGR02943 family)
MGIPSEDLPRMRSYLLRYATLQLRDPALAEDVVQETLLAAFNSPSRFSGKSAYKTWLVGILKHKIVDVVRKRSRDQSLFAAEETPESETAEEYFAADGHWREFPSNWGNPEQSLEDKRFWEVFERCLEAMPVRAARAFMMREFMELTSDEICKELAITPTNLWVLLHRARLGLRGCLEAKWFDGATGQKRC